MVGYWNQMLMHVDKTADQAAPITGGYWNMLIANFEAGNDQAAPRMGGYSILCGSGREPQRSSR